MESLIADFAKFSCTIAEFIFLEETWQCLR